MAWEIMGKQDESEPGRNYRARLQIFSPYNVKTINAAIRAIRFGYGVANVAAFGALERMMTIRSVVAVNDRYPGNSIPYASDKSEPWELQVEFQKSDHGTPMVVVVGVILALLIGVIGVTGWTVEKFNDGPAGETLSVAVLLLVAFGGLFVLTKYGRALS